MASQEDGGLSGVLGTLNSTQQTGVQNLGLIIKAIRETFPNWVAAPALATSSGVAGQVAYDNTHFYVCVSSSTWVRVTLATF